MSPSQNGLGGGLCIFLSVEKLCLWKILLQL